MALSSSKPSNIKPPVKPKPYRRRKGYRGGTTSRVAMDRLEQLERQWYERVDRDK